MVNKFLISIFLLIALTCLPIGLSNNTSYAHGHGHKQHGCQDCGHYICEGDCGKCGECLAKQKTTREMAEKCEQCGHVDCPDNCNKCVDCLNKRINDLERLLQRKE